jgi:hypothetical protein
MQPSPPPRVHRPTATLARRDGVSDSSARAGSASVAASGVFGGAGVAASSPSSSLSSSYGTNGLAVSASYRLVRSATTSARAGRASRSSLLHSTASRSSMDGQPGSARCSTSSLGRAGGSGHGIGARKTWILTYALMPKPGTTRGNAVALGATRLSSSHRTRPVHAGTSKVRVSVIVGHQQCAP